MTLKETLTKQKLQQEVVRWERVLAASQDPKPILYQLKRAKSRLKSFEITVDTHH